MAPVLTTEEANNLAKSKPPIDALLGFVRKKIELRRGKWSLTTLPFEDVIQIIMIRAWQKYHLFDPEKGPFENWINMLISNAIKTILRNEYLRFARPCIRDGGCDYNQGDNHCGYTPSGLQCAECKLYATWQEKKEAEYQVRSSVTIETHSQEVNSVQGDFEDIAEKKQIIDDHMKQELSPWSWKVYKLLYIDGLTPMKVSIKIKKQLQQRTRPLAKDEPIDYQGILQASKDMKQMIMEIIRRHDL